MSSSKHAVQNIYFMPSASRESLRYPIMSNRYLFFLLLSLLFYSCNDDLQQRIYSTKGGILIETYGASNNLIKRQYFNKDTLPNGKEIEYYTNGNIKKWKWHYKNKLPQYGVYYNEVGKFDSLKGNPFLAVVADDEDTSKTWVFVINPPNVNYHIYLDDEYNGKVIKRYRYWPNKEDSILCITIDVKAISDSTHKYIMYEVAADSSKRIYYRAGSDLQLIKYQYQFIDKREEIYPFK
jgi:hypothetical protein